MTNLEKTINIHGTDKEVKFVEVTESTGTLKVFFTDKTFVSVNGAKIIVK